MSSGLPIASITLRANGMVDVQSVSDGVYRPTVAEMELLADHWFHPEFVAFRARLLDADKGGVPFK